MKLFIFISKSNQIQFIQCGLFNVNRFLAMVSKRFRETTLLDAEILSDQTTLARYLKIKPWVCASQWNSLTIILQAQPCYKKCLKNDEQIEMSKKSQIYQNWHFTRKQKSQLKENGFWNRTYESQNFESIVAIIT